MDEVKKRLNSTGDGPECSFKPAVGNADAVLIHSRPERLGETPLERTERLSKLEAEAIKHKKETLNSIYYNQFDFKPRIDPVSEALVRNKAPKTVDELVNDERHARLMERLQAEKARVSAALVTLASGF